MEAGRPHQPCLARVARSSKEPVMALPQEPGHQKQPEPRERERSPTKPPELSPTEAQLPRELAQARPISSERKATALSQHAPGEDAA